MARVARQGGKCRSRISGIVMSSAQLYAEAHLIGSSPDDREEGRRVLMRLRQASHDPLAEALLRAHALMLGVPGLKALADSKWSQTEPWIYLKSTMPRHVRNAYILVLPNVWIDLDPSWHRQFKNILQDHKTCQEKLIKWNMHPKSRVRDAGHWLMRVLEATLLDLSAGSPLLVGIANFRVDAALPAKVLTQGSFLNLDRKKPTKSMPNNPLRGTLLEMRKPRTTLPVAEVDFLSLVQLDDPIRRLASLILVTILDESGAKNDRQYQREERYSRAQEEVLYALSRGEVIEATALRKKAWKTVCAYWPNLKCQFALEESTILEALISKPLEKVFEINRKTNAGAYNLVPPSIPLKPYCRSIEIDKSPLDEVVLWAFLMLLNRCGCRASDLYHLNAKSFHGVGSTDMCITLPYTKTTGRRTLPVGVALPPDELQQFGKLLRRLAAESQQETPWFCVITGNKFSPERWQYDFAYADFRRAIAPSGSSYLPTHIPRHCFATAFGLFYAGQILGGWDLPFFKIWTQDPSVQAICNSAIPAVYSSLHDALLLANQIMGHKTTHQFVGTYCHAWPLILAATAEARRPGKVSWDRLESML